MQPPPPDVDQSAGRWISPPIARGSGNLIEEPGEEEAYDGNDKNQQRFIVAYMVVKRGAPA